MIKRLVCDIDGTLIVNSQKMFEESRRKTLSRLRLLTEENLEKFREACSNYEDNYDRYAIKEYRMHMSKEMGIELPIEFPFVFFEELSYNIPYRTERMRKCLDDLKEKYEMVILSNYFKSSQMNRLISMGIDDYFMDCFGQEKTKPHKEAFLMACGKHSPEECVMIGNDLTIDIIPAKNLGMHVLLVNSKDVYKYEDDISLAGYPPFVDCFEDITPDLIESLFVRKGKCEI